MQPHSFSQAMIRAGSIGLLIWSGCSHAAGITAVTRRTVMSGVPGGGLGGAPANNGTVIVTSPQPQAAATVLLPGQTPLGAKTAAAGARVQVAAQPPPLRPGPGEALMARPAAATTPLVVKPAVGVRASTPVAAKAVNVPTTGTRAAGRAGAGAVPQAADKTTAAAR